LSPVRSGDFDSPSGGTGLDERYRTSVVELAQDNAGGRRGSWLLRHRQTGAGE
jgi:hypothetical protein